MSEFAYYFMREIEIGINQEIEINTDGFGLKSYTFPGKYNVILNYTNYYRTKLLSCLGGGGGGKGDCN